MKNKDLSFNQQCWQLLKKIPKGKVTTYKALANALNTKAYQAVGNAMAANPDLISVPCHRVINSDGRIGKFALGQAKKIGLLRSEGIEIKNNKVVDLEHYFFDFS